MHWKRHVVHLHTKLLTKDGFTNWQNSQLELHKIKWALNHLQGVHRPNASQAGPGRSNEAGNSTKDILNP